MNLVFVLRILLDKIRLKKDHIRQKYIQCLTSAVLDI